MPVTMSQQRKTLKIKYIKAELSKELNFIKNILSIIHIPIQSKGENSDADFDMVDSTPHRNEETDLPKRARNIVELEQKLEKIKSQNKFNLKNKLAKKSLTSKLNKKLKKRERLNKTRVKTSTDSPNCQEIKKEKKPDVNIAKPVFNNDGKLVFSKFDFANIDRRKDKPQKVEKDPKKLLESLKNQEQKLRQLEEKEGGEKAKEVQERLAWKNLLQKAEGQKVKDDPLLLKKSIKKMEQKKKRSKKQWDSRIKGVEQKKDERQKKRKDNIAKKKKEKKSKIVKASVKRGRVVI